MRSVLFLFLLLSCWTLKSQSEWLLNMSFEYGGQVPFADMEDRFGGNFKIGTEFEFMEANSKWLFGVEAHYLFGSKVKTDVLAPLRTEEGDVIGSNREPAAIFLRERGYHFGLYAGKLFPLFGEDQLKGIKFRLGAGFLQHKIRIQDDSQSVTQLTGEYEKGYDRLSNGISLTSFLGYQHYDPQKNMYFLFGFDLILGFTENRRTLNFDTMQREDDPRTDGLAGFKIGWILPIVKSAEKEETYY